MAVVKSRREFLKKSSLVVGGAVAFSGATLLTGCTPSSTVNAEVPSHPYAYVELDPALAEQVAYEGYYEGGCCYGVAKAILSQLNEKVGFPYTAIPEEMYKTGKEGYGAGTLCGALAGAVNMISLCVPTEDARELNSELFRWYSTTNLPLYRPEGLSDVQTVAASINCDDSVTGFKAAANVEQADPIRKERCGGISGDVARKTIELLNVYYGYATAPVETPKPEVVLKENEYLGEAQGHEGIVKVKVTMDNDKIANIEVLEHSETLGISDPAFNTIPQAIIDAQSTSIDVASGASVTSEAIMNAVNDALSKIK